MRQEREREVYKAQFLQICRVGFAITLTRGSFLRDHLEGLLRLSSGRHVDATGPKNADTALFLTDEQSHTASEADSSEMEGHFTGDTRGLRRERDAHRESSSDEEALPDEREGRAVWSPST